MTIAYDASALSGWCGLPRLVVRYRGTILAGTLTGPLFWIANVTHLGLLFVAGRLGPIGTWIASNTTHFPDVLDEFVPLSPEYNLPFVR